MELERFKVEVLVALLATPCFSRHSEGCYSIKLHFYYLLGIYVATIQL